jgi:uncharacterized protein (TIGR00255 family)
MLSMTGYGRGSAALGPSQLIIDVRSVNHRFLEVRLHLASELSGHGPLIEEHVRQHVVRGRAEVTARIEGQLPGHVTLNTSRARAAFVALRELRDELSPFEPLPLDLLASVPGLFRESGSWDETERAQACAAATQVACGQLVAMRRAEGERLAADLRQRSAGLTRRLDGLRPRLGELVSLQRDRLLARIAQLLPKEGTPLDHGRLEHEVALLADRGDITEELTRLGAHASAFEELLTPKTDEPVGHRLDFLLQEMGREANTAATKLPDAAATQVMLEIKAELLRMREQVQNVL